MSPRLLASRCGRAAALCGLGVLVGCHPTTPPDPPPSAETTTSATTTTAPPDDTSRIESPPIERCGSPNLTFADHGWAPADSPAVASLRLDDPDLPSALNALTQYARAPGHGLPIPLALSLSHWAWQVPTLISTLRAAGFEPAELTFIASKDAQHAWVWRSDCDLDRAIERIQSAWSVTARTTVDAVVATPTSASTEPDGPPPFPYDVLMLSGDRMALVPAGTGSTALIRLGRARTLGAVSTTAGARLDTVAEAPIRLVLLGVALVDPTTASAVDTQVLQVTAQGVTDATPTTTRQNDDGTSRP